MIGQLEDQVREMKESWDWKEKKLTQERDKALDAAKYVLNLIIVYIIGCSQLIGQLGEQVREMKESWDRKEVKLTQERDKALDAAK